MPIRGMTVEGWMSFFVTNDLNPQPISRIQHDLKNTALKDWAGLNRLPKRHSCRGRGSFWGNPLPKFSSLRQISPGNEKMGNGKEKEPHPFTDKDKETNCPGSRELAS